MRLALAVLLVLATLSGCVSLAKSPTAAPDGAGDAQEPAATDGPRQSSAGSMVASAPEQVTRLDHITEFHWASNASLDGFAMEYLVDFQKSDCKVYAGSSGGGLGPHMLSMEETSDGYAGVGWSSGGSASAHAGPVDTRDTSSASGGQSLHGMGGTFDGTMRFTLLANHVAPAERTSLVDEGYSVGISITCDKPFTVHDARAGTAHLFDPDNLAGGAGVSSEASADVQDVAAASFASPTVRVLAENFGVEAGRVQLDHPGGHEDWPMASGFFVPGLDGHHLVEDGPGDYTATVDYASVYISAFVLGMWGLDGPFDLQPGRLDHSALHSSF